MNSPHNASLSTIAVALDQFFNDIGRIASALETIALVQGGDAPDVAPRAVGAAPAHSQPYSLPLAAQNAAQAAPQTAEQAAAAEAAKPKRTRRTKEQIAADEAAALAGASTAASAVASVLGNAPQTQSFPPFGAPATPPAAAPFQAPTAPVGAAPGAMAGAFNPGAAFAAPTAPASTAAMPTPATVPMAAPVAQPQAANTPDTSAFEAQHNALNPDQQFAALLDAFAKYGNVLGVREALSSALAPMGVGMPLSDPLDRTKPGPQYSSLSNAQRWAIYKSVYLAATAAQSQPQM